MFKVFKLKHHICFSPATSVRNGEEDLILMDLSDLHVLDLDPSLKTLAQLAVIEYNLDTSSLPRDVRLDRRIILIQIVI